MITFLNKNIKNIIISIIAVSIAVYVIYSAFFGYPVIMMAHRAIFTAAMLVMYFTYLKPLGDSILAKTIDGLLVILALIPNFYIIFYYERILWGAGGAHLTDLEIAIGFLFIAICLEAARRASIPFFIICIVCVLYTFLGPYLPGILYHPGLALHRISYMVAFTSDGIFGVGISVGAGLMFMFMLFGSTMEVTGVGDFFMRFATSVVGRLRGGSGKTALVGSSLMGSIMGNATANVVLTGTFTIPLMIKSGFKKRMAGAIECYSSEGGQYLPPVMGAAAFIMAQVTRIPYADIVIAAFIPAIMYYVVGYIMIDAEAFKSGLRSIPSEQRESPIGLLKQHGHWLLPLVVVVYVILVLRMTPIYAAMLGVVVTLLVTQLTPPFKGRTIKSVATTFIRSLDVGSRNVGNLMGLLVGIGLVQQAFIVTGLGGRIASLLVDLAAGNLLYLVLIGFFAAIILGMGMPTPVAYLLVALFIAPAFVDLGIPILAAHMFLFYIAVKSASTPPVGTAAMIASNIAKADWWGTAVRSVTISIPAFIIAASFVFHPELLLLEGELSTQIFRIFLTFLAAVGLVFAIQGNTMFSKFHFIERILCTVASILLIFSDSALITAGLVIIGLLLFRGPFWAFYMRRREIANSSSG